MDVIVIDTPALGDRSYLVHDGEVALVVDPQRDTDRVEAAAAWARVRITHVAETHIHNDYVTGGLHLAGRLGIDYLVNAVDDVQFERTPVRDGQQLQVGALQVVVVATPGHTENHLSYVVTHDGEQAVFSGGSLLFGSVGRTDLGDPTRTELMTRAQYASVRRLSELACQDAGLYPTHGFGSFCSSGPATGASSSTVGEQLSDNHALTDTDEEHFVRELIANLGEYPSYYAHMRPANLAGPAAADLCVPRSLEAQELTRRLRDGEWVVDLRNRVAFADDHLAGVVSFEYADGASFTTFLGWVLPWGEPLTLVGTRDDVTNAVRDLSRIGVDSPDVALGNGPEQVAPGAPTTGYPRLDWHGMLADRTQDDVVLDVRRTDEYTASHVDGAVNVPLHELLGRVDELPDARLLVHCASGYRAGVGASLLQRAGRDVVHVDALFADAAAAGVPLTTRVDGGVSRARGA